MPITDRVAADLPATIKTSDYTLLPDDFGREIQFESATARTAFLPPVIEAGNGYNVIIRNIGSANLTVDAAGSEEIDGASTATLIAGDWLWIRSDGTEWKSIAGNGGGSPSSGGELVAVTFYTSTASTFTWNKSTNNPDTIKVTVVGGGGGGGFSDGSNHGGGGGGGAGAAIRYLSDSAIPTSATITVGAGGAAGTSGSQDGGNGLDSKFANGVTDLVVGGGGTGGQKSGLDGSNDILNGAEGGNGSLGDINIKGGGGGMNRPVGDANWKAGGGQGGSSILGGGAPVRNFSNTGTSSAGLDGGNYGGGGQGGGMGSFADLNGGAGASGIVIVEEYSGTVAVSTNPT